MTMENNGQENDQENPQGFEENEEMDARLLYAHYMASAEGFLLEAAQLNISQNYAVARAKWFEALPQESDYHTRVRERAVKLVLETLREYAMGASMPEPEGDWLDE